MTYHHQDQSSILALLLPHVCLRGGQVLCQSLMSLGCQQLENKSSSKPLVM